MVELVNRGVFLLRGEVVLEDADKLGVGEVNNRLKSAGHVPLTEQ